MKDLSVVVGEVVAEREGNQYVKWPPGQDFAEYKERSFSLWLLMATDYLDRARHELTAKPGRAASREQLVKAANLILWALQSEENVD
jgi:hypothetical protein